MKNVKAFSKEKVRGIVMGKKDIKDDIKEEIEEVVKDSELKEDVINKDEYIAKLNDDLKVQKEKADEYFDSLKRNMAEFDNFKKRMTKEKTTMYSSVVCDVLSDLFSGYGIFD